MDTIMAVISLLFFIVMIVGLIKPSAVLGFMKTKTRKRVLLVYGLPFFLIPFFSGLIKGPPNSPSSPPSNQPAPSPQVSEQREAPRVQESKGGSVLYNMAHNEPPAQPSPPQYVSTDFAEYNRYLGINSDMTEMQKDELFNSKYKNGHIKWKGRVVEVDKGVFGGLHVMVKHSSHSLVSDVYLDLKSEEEAKALQLRKGQTITYTGRLTGWGNLTDHRVDEGAILEIR